MRKKQKSKWIVLLASLAAIFLLGGCSFHESFEQALANRDLVAQVTYYSNGGAFDGSPEKKELYYKQGAQALNIGVVNPSNGTVKLERSNYIFDGWYYAVLDDNGNPVYEDEATKTYKLGDKVDFSVPLGKGDHWIVVAKWIATVKVNVVLVCDGDASIPVKVKDGEAAISYKNGDVVETRPYNTAGQVVNPGDGKAPFTVDGKDFTFVEYYADEACTELVKWPIEKQKTDVNVYAKYIKGDWEIVRSAKDASDMFNQINASKRYWLTKDIDASGRKIAAKSAFEGEIQGNGFKISNLSVQKSKITGGSTVSLFGNVGANTTIANLTLDGLTMEYSLQSSPVNIYFVFSSIAEGAKIENVKLSGVMTVTKSAEHILSTGLYGGYTSDSEYIEQTQGKGFVVEGDPEQFIKINIL